MTLVGHWPLNEDSGDAIDYSGNGNHGTVYGATQGAGGILGETGYSFNRSNSEYIDTENSYSFTDPHNLTLAMWIYPTNTTDTQPVVAEYDNGEGFTYRLHDASGNGNVQLQYHSRDGSGDATREETHQEIVANEWQHIAWVSRGTSPGNNDLYINGVKQTTNIASDDGLSVYNFSYNTAIARDWHNGRFYDGRMYDVRFYNRGLTPQEMSYLYEVPQRGTQVSSVKTI